MRLSRKLAAGIYAINGVVSVALGWTYLLRDEFMPYHAVAVGTEWAALDEPVRILVGSLMDVAGGAWAATGIILLALVAFPFRRGDRWARWTIPAGFVLLYAPMLYAILTVMASTPAVPPWYGTVTSLVTASIALLLDRPWRADHGPTA